MSPEMGPKSVGLSRNGSQARNVQVLGCLTCTLNCDNQPCVSLRRSFQGVDLPPKKQQKQKVHETTPGVKLTPVLFAPFWGKFYSNLLLGSDLLHYPDKKR